MPAGPAPARAPAPEEIRAIASIPDSVQRNLRITECYHRLSLAMAARIGAGANWCTFATWASKQAGKTIRGEDLFDRLAEHAQRNVTAAHPVQALWRALLRRGIFNPRTRLGRIVGAVHSPFDALERASQAVARGNLRVFEEIATEFARYLATCPADGDTEGEPFQAFVRKLRPGEPPGGQDYLRCAFADYHRFAPSMEESEASQLALLANLEIGLHEQIRLQPEIQQALEVAPETLADLSARVRRVLGPGIGVFSAPAAYILLPYRRYARTVTRRVVTEVLMTLALPGAVLRLGMNLDRACPEGFREIRNPKLRALCGKWEPESGACGDCGADDWADLNQRMHYILHLFRSFHFEPSLMAAPFQAAQTSAILSGRLPDGNL